MNEIIKHIFDSKPNNKKKTIYQKKKVQFKQ